MSQKINASKIIDKIWLCVMSICLWFTLATTPVIMIFPDLGPPLLKYCYVNEIFWILDIFRKLLFAHEPGQDAYASAVRYIKSTLILDVLAALPQMVTTMHASYAFFKNIRIY